jgi:hypothetical protein
LAGKVFHSKNLWIKYSIQRTCGPFSRVVDRFPAGCLRVLGCFLDGPVSIVAGGRGRLCHAREMEIASVISGLAVLGAAWGLTRGFWAVLRVWGEDLFPVSCADGRRLAWLAGGDDLGEVGDGVEVYD